MPVDTHVHKAHSNVNNNVSPEPHRVPSLVQYLVHVDTSNSVTNPGECFPKLADNWLERPLQQVEYLYKTERRQISQLRWISILSSVSRGSEFDCLAVRFYFWLSTSSLIHGIS